MRLVWLSLKDLTVTARDPKTVFLMFAAPLIIMLLVGAIFFTETGVQPATTKQIPIGACIMDTGGHASAFADELSKQFSVTREYGPECEKVMDEQLSLGRIRAYVSVPAGFTQAVAEGRQAIIVLKTDNAKPDIASIITSVNQGIVYAAAQEMGRTFLNASWEELRSMSVNIDELARALNESERQITEINNKTSQTTAKINSLDTTSLRDSIHSSRVSIESLTADAAALRVSVKDSADDVGALNASMAVLQSAVANVTAGIGVLRSDITGIGNDLNSAYTDAYCKDAAAFPAINETMVLRWKGLCADIISLNSSLHGLDQDLGKQGTYLAQLNASAASTQANLTLISAEIADVEDKLSALDELGELNSTLAYMESAVDDLQRVQSEAAANLGETSAILGSVGANITSLKAGAAEAKQKLDALAARDPVSVITPFSLETRQLFGGIRYLDAMFPSILAVILMFVTVLFSAVTVIKEKKTGTLKRVLLSPTTPLEFVLSKVSLVVVIAILQAVMLLAVAGAVFAVSINWPLVPYSFIVIALIAVTFSSIGMTVASLSDSENTALLASLVVCIPLLFLSGVFFPRELMIEPVRWMSLASPLTHSVVLLEQFFVYNIDPFAVGGFLTGLIVWTALSLAASNHFVSKLKSK